MIDEVRICQRCGKEYQPFNTLQKYCSTCKVVSHKHLKVCFECGKEYYPTGSRQKWCPECRPKMNYIRQKAASKDWAEKHPERHLEIHHKAAARRKQELGSIFLNSPFKGCVGHHIDLAHIIYIPREMHHSIAHDVQSGQGMEAINTLAFAFLQGQK
jgi:hypothetical protein